MASTDEETYYRKGFGLKTDVQDTLASDYTGRLVDLLRASDYTLTSSGVTVRLAKEFGFCYGVERAVEYASFPIGVSSSPARSSTTRM
jgi:4-hydroxy-3-methylbut-2-en-1-yl diphosphate reductase